MKSGHLRYLETAVELIFCINSGGGGYYFLVFQLFSFTKFLWGNSLFDWHPWRGRTILYDGNSAAGSDFIGYDSAIAPMVSAHRPRRKAGRENHRPPRLLVMKFLYFHQCIRQPKYAAIFVNSNRPNRIDFKCIFFFPRIGTLTAVVFERIPRKRNQRWSSRSVNQGRKKKITNNMYPRKKLPE